MRSYEPVAALMRGLKVLEVLNELGTVSLLQLHQQTKMPKPTIVRILETLIHSGYVTHSAPGTPYSLTAKVLSLSKGFDVNDRLVALASPILRDLRASMPWPSDFAVFDRDAMVIIETNRNPGTFGLNRSKGTRMPMLISAVGRAFLAFCPDDVRRRTLDLLSISPNPLDAEARNRAAFERKLAIYRKQGFSVNDGDLSPATRVIAVPVLVGEEVIAAVNGITLAEAMTLDQVIERCLSPLQNAASRIADAVERERAGNVAGANSTGVESRSGSYGAVG